MTLRQAIGLPAITLAVWLPALVLAAPLAAVAPPPAAAASQPAAQGAGEPAVKRTVIEDDGVRIEELRVRGQNKQISVQSKAAGGGSRYQILTGDDGRDLSQDRRATGQSVWHLFSF